MITSFDARVTAWAPVAVFAYSRPDKLAEVMASLQRCDGFYDSPVTIFVDGPRSVGDSAAVESVRRVASSIEAANVSCEFSQVNRGLRNAIFAGVTKLVRQYGRVIVIEDDLVLSSVALRYFNHALQAYEFDTRVWHISGYIYDVPALRTRPNALMLPFANPWGWATWKRAWDQFELDSQPSEEQLGAKSFSSAFDLDGFHPYTNLLRSSIRGLVDSWFIHWYYTMFSHGGVAIFPPRRVSENFGTNKGTHGGKLNPYHILVRKPGLLRDVPTFGNTDNVDYVALDSLKKCQEARVRRLIAKAGLVKRRLLQYKVAARMKS